ncbi:hypothetical protein AB205_0142610 [Aquarana catesbeiana]|uniref:Uncharacterized protein n=1 Tax=Aquarana catesbeiana TaxID=8400 RepID=A0A2G9QC67_AQUCT|nr:hypothetical protein AB205_0142610 [Aquarana catesbeiana]
MASKSRVIPSLVIMEIEKYFSDQKTKGKKMFKDAVRGEGVKERKRKQKDLQELPKLSRVDVEEAYRNCQTNAERHSLLSDLLVRRGEGVTSTSRRVGPELSKRIYLQFTSLQPELSLDL